MHLRDAAQRVCILYPPAIAMGLADLAAFEHPAQIRCGFDLARMRTRLVNALIKCNIGPAKRVERHGSNHVSGIDKDFASQQSQGSDGQHRLGSINERNRFFRLEYQGLDLRPAQCLCPWKSLSVSI